MADAPRPEERGSGPPKSSANQRRGRKDAGVNPFPFPLCVRHENLHRETCLKIWFGTISRVQELDQENNSGQTPKLTNPTQLSDTPQEEALRLDI